MTEHGCSWPKFRPVYPEFHKNFQPDSNPLNWKGMEMLSHKDLLIEINHINSVTVTANTGDNVTVLFFY